MTPPRFLAGVLAALLSVALVCLAPAHAVAPAGDPLVTTVTGACAGGPGRLSLAVHPTAGGRVRVEISARGLAEGSRWTGQVDQEIVSGRIRQKDFRTVAVDGGWTVATRFPAPKDPEAFVFFYVDAQERDDRGHRCSLVSLSASWAGSGLAECNRRQLSIVLSAYERNDGSTVVGSLIFGAHPDSRWHLTLTATGASSRQEVNFSDFANKGAAVRSRVVLTGIEDPRLRLVARNTDQGRCFIGLNPPNVTTDAPMTLKGLGKLSALTR